MGSRRISIVAICFLLLLQVKSGFDFAAGRPILTRCAVAQGFAPAGICLMVKDTVYSFLEEKLQRWKTDKENLGASVLLKVISTEPPSTIRSFLKNMTDLAGCLMVGDIPYVEFEWNYSDIYGKQYYDRFPSDLYFMDLNGEWIDSNGNGAYDKILGDLGPEIWVGRLKASNLSGNEIDLLKRYFDKNHDFMTGALTMPPRALVYVDESTPEATDGATKYYTGELALKTRDGLSKICPEMVLVRSLEYTNASDYLNRLRESWSLVRLIVHSGGFGHYFIYDGKWDGKIYPLDIKNSDPKCLFYLITSCNNFDYRKRDFMGAWYVFGSYGLLALGDSSVLDILNVLPEVFYSALRTECFGNAYLTWSRECVKQNMNARNIINYVLFGDPSLGTDPAQRIPEFQTAIPVATSVIALALITGHACRRRNKKKANLIENREP